MKKGFVSSELIFTVLRASGLPKAKAPRWCVLGRSNVGKSSFLNAITHPQKIFRTGKTPGLTLGLVAARCQVAKPKDAWLEIVDTPGFGFVQNHTILMNKWEALLDALAERTETPIMWVWLVDPMREPFDDDKHMLNWLGEQPFMILFSKSDRIKKNHRPAIEKIWHKFIQRSSEKPLWVSSQDGEGLDEVFKSARAFVQLSNANK